MTMETSKLKSLWHPDKNDELSLDNIVPGSAKKAWWQCNNGHEWQAEIRQVYAGSGCPFCKNKRACLDNCLSTINPELAAEWHPNKNGELNPQIITPGSNKKVWWQCIKGHEWQATVNARTYGSGCPFCSNKKVCWDNCLQNQNPKLALEWHPDKNGDLSPKNVVPGSNKKVWWKCKKEHEWQAIISSRNNGNNCPYCSGLYASKDNNFAVKNPLLVQEWHTSKNGTLTPDTVSPMSEKKVWWICKRGHIWQAQVNSRSQGTGCPECIKNLKSSFPEQTIYYYFIQVFKNVKNRYKTDIKFSDNPRSMNIEVDIYIPEINLGIEYDGVNYHNNKKSIYNDTRKDEKLADRIQLVRVIEKGLKQLPKSKTIVFQRSDNNIESLQHVVSDLRDYILTRAKFMQIEDEYIEKLQDLDIDIARDTLKIHELLNNIEIENSLAKHNPELAKEWHPTKNGSLIPDHFAKNSKCKVWWICDKGHEWQVSILNRNFNKNGCPYCAGQFVCEDNCLATVNPSLASEWHPTKNNLSPSEVVPGTDRKVWWICQKGHEWQASVSKRSSGKGCPYCAGLKVCADNCLAVNYPEISNQWHPTKNGALTPHDVVWGSQKKVWWICSKGHEWETTISHRTGTGGKRCPYCINQKVNIDNCLSTTNPELASQWHPIKNGETTPFDITAGSSKKFWWICKKGHEWKAATYKRNNEVGCPYCSNKLACDDNCLATTIPELMEYWHPSNNKDITPYSITAGSSKKVWWLCSKCEYEWKIQIRFIVNNKIYKCPNCHDGVINNSKCYGYELDERGGLIINQTESIVVKTIYNLSILGNSDRIIAKKLDSLGIKSPKGQNHWDKASIGKILCNKKYVGYLMMGKLFEIINSRNESIGNEKDVQNYLANSNHPAIISLDQFEKAQSERVRRRKR